MKQTARGAALAVLERCRRDGAWSSDALDSALKRDELEGRDAALAARLVLSVLQNSAYCDYYIERCGGKSPARLQPKLLDILRLGTAQLLLLDRIPPRAAVNETVSLCREAGLARASGLVNAVLRRVSESRDALPPIPGEGTADYLSIRTSHPKPLVERLLREHDYAFVERFLRANNSPAGLTVQVNTQLVTPEDYARSLQRAGIPFTAFPELPGCLRLEGGAVSALPGFEEGLFYVQDRAARSAVAVSGVKPGMRVLDCCAAPGGKSFAAALAMGDSGSILACDIHEKKLRRIENGAERLGLSCIRTRAMDARKPESAPEGAFDLVLADVPCSGLGVIGKRPEIRYKSGEEIDRLPAIQREILRSVSRCVKPGGVLLYSTCTVLDAENGEQIDAFLQKNPDFCAEDFSLGPIRSTGGRYTFWPHIDGTDGFFAAKLRRKE